MYKVMELPAAAHGRIAVDTVVTSRALRRLHQEEGSSTTTQPQPREGRLLPSLNHDSKPANACGSEGRKSPLGIGCDQH